MRRKYIVLIVSISALVVYCLAYNCIFERQIDTNIKVICSYNEMLESAKNWDNKTLVLFDVDDTLIHGPYLFPDNFLNRLIFRFRLLLRYPWMMQPTLWEEYYSIMWQQAKRVLIEPKIAIIIKQLQERGVVILGLTSMETGSYGVIKSMPEWRYEMLSDLGIKFSDRFENAVFADFKPYRSHYPMLYKGILCCNRQPKAMVLEAFLKKFQVKPSRIVFFDDQCHEVKGVMRLCHQYKIVCEGYQYMGAKRFDAEWDMDKALAQVDFLVQYHVWPS